MFLLGAVKSVTVAYLVTVSSHKLPQHPNTVRKQLRDYHSSRAAVNQSDSNALADSEACPLLNTSTPKQQAPAVTDTRTPITGARSLQSVKPVEHAPPPLAKPQPLRPLEQLHAPLTRAEEAYFTHLVRIQLEQSNDKKTVVCKTRGQQITLKRVIKPTKMSCFAASALITKRANTSTKYGRNCQVPQQLTQWIAGNRGKKVTASTTYPVHFEV